MQNVAFGASVLEIRAFYPAPMKRELLIESPLCSKVRRLGRNASKDEDLVQERQDMSHGTAQCLPSF